MPPTFGIAPLTHPETAENNMLHSFFGTFSRPGQSLKTVHKSESTLPVSEHLAPAIQPTIGVSIFKMLPNAVHIAPALQFITALHIAAKSAFQSNPLWNASLEPISDSNALMPQPLPVLVVGSPSAIPLASLMPTGPLPQYSYTFTPPAYDMGSRFSHRPAALS